MLAVVRMIFPTAIVLAIGEVVIVTVRYGDTMKAMASCWDIVLAIVSHGGVELATVSCRKVTMAPVCC